MNGNVDVPSEPPSSDHSYASLVPLSNRPSEQSLMRVRAFNYKCSIRYMTCLLGKRDVKEGVGGGQEDHCCPQKEEHGAELIINLQTYICSAFPRSILSSCYVNEFVLC